MAIIAFLAMVGLFEAFTFAVVQEWPVWQGWTILLSLTGIGLVAAWLDVRWRVR